MMQLFYKINIFLLNILFVMLILKISCFVYKGHFLCPYALCKQQSPPSLLIMSLYLQGRYVLDRHRTSVTTCYYVLGIVRRKHIYDIPKNSKEFLLMDKIAKKDPQQNNPITCSCVLYFTSHPGACYLQLKHSP